MKRRTRTSRKAWKHKPAGHKLWRAIMRRQYGKAWREFGP
jgi:hypothetical protein